MPITIRIGKEGDQAFKIEALGVSRNHATLTITDNGEWWLEDNNSANGTFVRSEDGVLRRISKQQIKPMSFICLGDDSAMGCSFYAKQLCKSGDYLEEHLFLKKKAQEMDEALAKLGKQKKIMKWVSILLTAAVTFILIGTPFVTSVIEGVFNMTKEDSANLMWPLRIIVTGAVGTICNSLFSGDGAREKVKKQFELFNHCPNPNCSHHLTTSEIYNMQCNKCKK